jgi:hypothetical protein
MLILSPPRLRVSILPVRIIGNRISIERPGALPPPKKPTRADLIAERNEKRKKLDQIRVGRAKGDAIAFGISMSDEADLEREIVEIENKLESMK